MTDKELLAYVQKIQQYMMDVATGTLRIQDADNSYKELYHKINVELADRDVDLANPHSSLWDFYDYWSTELPSYQSRRAYIRSLYKDVEDSLQESLIKKERAKQSVSPSGSKTYKLSFDDLHEQIVIQCKDLFFQGKYEEAIHNAFKLLEVRVRERAGMTDANFGSRLMHLAFEPTQTKFIIADDQGEVVGWQKLYSGAIAALKNPHSHRFNTISQQEAFQVLSFASFLLNFLEGLQIREEGDATINLDDIPF